MYEYIKGEIVELSPSKAIIESSGIGFFINISINTFEKIKEQKEVKIYIHQIIKEDSHDFFGFAEKSEREIFRQLISVSGIGANTARLMLSAMRPEKIVESIVNSDVDALKNIKGIGIKTAQRIIVDLKDKFTKDKFSDILPFDNINNSNANESIAALTMLGFNKKATEETVYKITKLNHDLSVEQIVKDAIKAMSK